MDRTEEDRRFEMAKAALTAILMDSTMPRRAFRVAELAVCYADAVLHELDMTTRSHDKTVPSVYAEGIMAEMKRTVEEDR